MDQDQHITWMEQMNERYREILALGVQHPDLPLSDAIARVEAEHQPVTPEWSDPAGVPTPELSADQGFDPDPEVSTDVVARLVRLEQMMNNLTSGAGMNGLLSDLGIEPTQPTEPVLEDGSISIEEVVPGKKVVIPDGFDMPSEELSEARQQYAEAVNQLDIASRSLNEVANGWRDLMINPALPVKLCMVLLPILRLVAGSISTVVINDDVQYVTIPGYVSNLVQRMAAATSAEQVASVEFNTWALGELMAAVEDGIDPRAAKIKANLEATGLLG